MDRVELVSEIVELVAAVAILGAWITGHIQTDELVGQIVILVAVEPVQEISAENSHDVDLI